MNRTVEATREMKDSGIEWIGKIPQEWELAPLKAILKERKEKNLPIKTTNILSLTIDKGVIPYSEKSGGGNKAKEDLTAYKLTYPNDIVLNSMNVIAGAVGLSKYFGAVSPVYYTLYGDEKINCTSYFNDIFQTQAFQKSLLGLGNGIMMKESSTGKLNTIRMRIPMEKLKSVMLPVPPLHEQQAIANYLDEQVGKIDELITEQRIAIEKWKEYKQSLITETVTKGLNPDVEMKDSGIEWVGEIPSNWETVFINQLFTQLKNKNTEMQETNLLSLSYGKIVRKNIETKEGLLPENFNGYNVINAGDIVLRLTDLQNDQRSLRCGIAKERGIITSAYVTLRNIKPLVNNYYYYLIHAYDIMKVFYGMGSGVRQGLTFDGLKKMRLLVPSIENQQQIADYLDEKCSKIDESIQQKQVLIQQLEEYKQSLIYECVTGKRCVEER